jgi:uncharacterized membrane protein
MTQDFSTPVVPAAAPDNEQMQRLQTLNTVGTISYVLHLIVAVGAVVPGGQFGPVLLIAALMIDLLKRGDAQGTWHASHFRWRIRTVLIAGALYLLTAPLWLMLVVPGWIAWMVTSVWFLYRIVTGFMAMNKGQAMEAAA